MNEATNRAYRLGDKVHLLKEGRWGIIMLEQRENGRFYAKVQCLFDAGGHRPTTPIQYIVETLDLEPCEH